MLPEVPLTTGWTWSCEQPGNSTVTFTEPVSFGGVTRSAGKLGHEVWEPLGTLVPSTVADADCPGASDTTGSGVPLGIPPMKPLRVRAACICWLPAASSPA